MDFNYQDERFADVQLLRYRLEGFERLTLNQKLLVYYLSQATLYGRDITFDQNGRWNLLVRKVLEVVYTVADLPHDTADFRALETYLKRVWFSSGVYHHYGSEKFKPGFSRHFLHDAMSQAEVRLQLPYGEGETFATLWQKVERIVFDEDFMPKRVNKADGADLVRTSACNFYVGVTQQEAEEFYARKKAEGNAECPQSYGLNTTLVKENGQVSERTWKADGLYGSAIRKIVYWLRKASQVAENEQQRKVIALLVKYYETGDLDVFNDYCIEWLNERDAEVDFINGFIEVYGDPLGLKGSWEALVEYVDKEATRRTRIVSDNAQWFEDHSPVDPRFRKPVVRGVSAKVICAAMLGGEEYPSTAIGINLPNADWIRARHGSKSITISNITDAYSKAAKGNGFKEEFVVDRETLLMIEKYGDICDNLHTDLHECLGHGSGQLLQGTDPDALKAYGNTIEEARADLFGLYYMADEKLVELGLLPDAEAYKSQYYTYMMNGLMTQLIRIAPGRQLEEAHMRNRALIAHWCLENGHAMKLSKHNGKTYLEVTDYEELRTLIGRLLAEVQRIKSEGDYDAARELVERYAVKVDEKLHEEVLRRYERLDLAPYKGFINPVLLPVYGADGNICDIQPYYGESYVHQMLRYGSEYGTLI